MAFIQSSGNEMNQPKAPEMPPERGIDKKNGR